MTKEHVLTAEGLEKRFGQFQALRGVSAGIPAHAITSIIGPNGAGKTTFFNILSGSLKPTQGRVLLNGREITREPHHRFARLGIAKSFQITSVFRGLTVFENVLAAAQGRSGTLSFWRHRSAKGEERDSVHNTLLRVGLGECLHASADSLSHGQQRALEIAIAIVADPKVLLLDEPTAGMGPEETRWMMNLILALSADRTIVLVEHKMKLVMEISEHIMVFHQGSLLDAGKPIDIRNNERVQRAYLGDGGRLASDYRP